MRRSRAPALQNTGNSSVSGSPLRMRCGSNARAFSVVVRVKTQPKTCQLPRLTVASVLIGQTHSAGSLSEATGFRAGLAHRRGGRYSGPTTAFFIVLTRKLARYDQR
jgi:hypothetical protein